MSGWLFLRYFNKQKTNNPSQRNYIMSLKLLSYKKFKYKKSLLAAILSPTLLAGCDGGG